MDNIMGHPLSWQISLWELWQHCCPDMSHLEWASIIHIEALQCFWLFCISVISVIWCRFLRVLTNEDIVWLQVSVDNAELVHVPHLGTGWLTMTDYDWLDSARGRKSFDLWPTLANFGHQTPIKSCLVYARTSAQEKQKHSGKFWKYQRNILGTSLELSLISRVFSYGIRIAGGRATHQTIINIKEYQRFVQLENECKKAL